MGKKKAVTAEKQSVFNLPATTQPQRINIADQMRTLICEHLEDDKPLPAMRCAELFIEKFPELKKSTTGKPYTPKDLYQVAIAAIKKLGLDEGKTRTKKTTVSSNGDLHDLEIENKALRLLYSTGDIEAVLASIDELKENPAFDFVNACGGIAKAKERLQGLGV